MKGYIEERAVELANYIIERKTTVRAAAKKYGISKSTVHMVISKWNGFLRFAICNKIADFISVSGFVATPSIYGGGVK